MPETDAASLLPELARDPDALRDALVAREPLAAADPGAVRVVHAPGRVNLIGEHTDYNDGFVLPVAIDLGISIALVPADDGRAELTLAATGETGVFDVADAGERRGSWLDYVAGMAWAWPRRASRRAGSAGCSRRTCRRAPASRSSAALEVASAWALSGGDRPRGESMDLVRVVQRSRERLHRPQQRDHGPVRVDLRRAGPGAAARLPVARAPVRSAPAGRRRAGRLPLGLAAQARGVRLQRAAGPVRGRGRGDRGGRARRALAARRRPRPAEPRRRPARPARLPPGAPRRRREPARPGDGGRVRGRSTSRRSAASSSRATTRSSCCTR